MQEPPGWYQSAIATVPERRTVHVADAPITYRAWGEPSGDLVVLIHGGAAHAGWWDHIGPHLAAETRVIAIDLSGHGDSGHRPEYTFEHWADEVMAVVRTESSRPPLVIGHSMGGFVALTVARLHGQQLRGAAAIDSPVRQESSESLVHNAAHGGGFTMHLADNRDTLVARFRTIPADRNQLEYALRHVAEQSVIETDGGWRWKFDPRVFLHGTMSPETLASCDCPIALIRGERGMATVDITDDVRTRLGGSISVTVIPDGGHHLMLDQPLALIAALQTLIGQWRTP